jgi:ubiquinone/menaquinone biosynthesis C-methylase UbiE
MITVENLKTKFDQFANLAESHILSKPWMIIILMHEFYRNLYPTDPFLPFKENESPSQRIYSVLNKSITLIKDSSFIDSYFTHNSSSMTTIINRYNIETRKKEEQTQKVYDNLWDKFDSEVYIKEAKSILEQRFKYSNLNFSSLEGKTILDMGCGSGRYTIALAILTNAKMVHGVDLGKSSFNNAKKIVKKLNIKNIKFDIGDCLQLPYKDNSFDFVFSNGVLHHTTNREKGIQEFYRILKLNCQGFLYLYGSGGLFWYARKKMNVLMKKIPQEYAMDILSLIGMPQNRFIFCDNWYVPIERHTTKDYLENYLKKIGFTNVKKISSSRTTDFDNKSRLNDPESKLIYGDGEHRYLITKSIQ